MGKLFIALCLAILAVTLVEANRGENSDRNNCCRNNGCGIKVSRSIARTSDCKERGEYCSRKNSCCPGMICAIGVGTAATCMKALEMEPLADLEV